MRHRETILDFNKRKNPIFKKYKILYKVRRLNCLIFLMISAKNVFTWSKIFYLKVKNFQVKLCAHAQKTCLQTLEKFFKKFQKEFSEKSCLGFRCFFNAFLKAPNGAFSHRQGTMGKSNTRCKKTSLSVKKRRKRNEKKHRKLFYLQFNYLVCIGTILYAPF